MLCIHYILKNGKLIINRDIIFIYGLGALIIRKKSLPLPFS